MNEPLTSPADFMREAIALSREGMESGRGGPFGALIVKDGVIIARGQNHVLDHNDPTAHAEVMAIREACNKLGHFQLQGAVIYSSCEPCPMCLSAIYWAHLDKIYFAASRDDAAEADFDDEFLYEEIKRPIQDRSIPTEQMLRDEALAPFEFWRRFEGRRDY